MNLKEEIKNRSLEFKTLCQNHKVNYLYAFGSSITDKFNEKLSDIDLLIDIGEEDPIERGEKLISIWNKFEVFFNRKIDLLTESSIKNPVLRKNIDSTKILIYDSRGQKVFV